VEAVAELAGLRCWAEEKANGFTLAKFTEAGGAARSAMGAVAELPGLRYWVEPDNEREFAKGDGLVEAWTAKGMKSFYTTCGALAGVVKLIIAAVTLASANRCSIEYCLAWSAMGTVAELLGRGC
jgi:hypothetical protein